MFRVFLLCVSLLSASVLYYSLTAAGDEYQLWKIDGEIGRWDRAGFPDDDRALARYVETADEIVSRREHDPRAYLLSARLYEWLAYVQRFDPRHERVQLDRAKIRLKEALAQRPYWASAWGALLVVTARRERAVTPEVARYFDTAMRLGQYDAQTQPFLVGFCVQQWPRLPGEIQSRAREFLKAILAGHGPGRDYAARLRRSPVYRRVLDEMRP